MNDAYLGDGVYAGFDGYSIVLDLRGQDDMTRIALEPSVMSNLIEYQNEIRRRLQEAPPIDPDVLSCFGEKPVILDDRGARIDEEY